MKLSKGEFSQFNLKSKIQLLKDNGRMLMTRKLDNIYEIRLFAMYDFYVEVFFNYQKNQIIKIEPILNNNWLDVYFSHK
jgi:hypothetical protein